MDFYMTRNELYNFIVCNYTDLNFSYFIAKQEDKIIRTFLV